ncbi:MAG: type IV pilus secretin PilQ [Candidatus Zixiibacteriota bacterium]|nr:MAG: type IV pilus secretin PilQ [candidate division Zixibacteria bacterium]
MRRISFWIALMAALGCIWFLNIGALQSQEDMEIETDRSAPKVIKNLSLTNADIKSVLMYLSSYSGVNIVASPSVEGEVTVRLSNITWKEALNIILETYVLVGVESENYIRVVKAEDYYAEKTAEEKHLMEQETMIPLSTHVVSVKYNVAGELKKAVQALLSGRGTVDHDQRTNSLIIRDLPENLGRVDELISVLDKETKQIKISAQLLEVESGFLREIGVDWRIVNAYGLDTPVEEVDPDNEIDPLFPANPDRQNYASEEVLVRGTRNVLTDRLGQFSFARLVEDYTINGILATIESSDKGKIIAHPEVTTLDNVEAYIQMGQKIPIKQFDPSGNTIITFYDVGTKLKVTPHITSENRVLMHLAPERSSYQFDPNGVIINTQHAETNVVVENGETAVIGGLTNQENKTIRTGLPILKDIPVIGFLFGYEKKEVTTRDLVIFVTPTIIEPPIQAFNE